MLVGRRLLFVRFLSFLPVPNFKTPAATNEHDLAFESDLFAKIDRENEPALFVDRTMFRAGVELTKKNAPIARGNTRVGFRGGAHTRKFFRRHDQKKLVSRFRKNDELFGITAAPAGGNSDSILFVDGVTKFAGEEALVRLLHWRAGNCSILTHFSPLLTTFRAKRQYLFIPFFACVRRVKFPPTMLRELILACLLALITSSINAQPPAPNSNDTIRVTVTVNGDGSRTTYQYDQSKHEAIATTADADGKARGKVVYRIDDAGRFETGIVYGADGKFMFKTIYKYDGAGRLEQESRLAKDDSVINKIIYKYDAAGKQTGYSMFDASGKLMSGSTSPTPTASPKTRKALGR